MNQLQARPWWGVMAAVVALAGLQGQPLQAQGQAGDSRMSRSGTTPDTDEDGQPRRLPPRPAGMAMAMIVQGDSLFRGKGGCTTCHGPDGAGMPAMGSSLTGGLHFIAAEWGSIDSLIKTGIPEPVTRTPIAMPPRGAQSNLTDQETRTIAAYVWAISQVRGEPWPGGHQGHGQSTALADTAGRRRQPTSR